MAGDRRQPLKILKGNVSEGCQLPPSTVSNSPFLSFSFTVVIRDPWIWKGCRDIQGFSGL